jgi:hypothetical protein
LRVWFSGVLGRMASELSNRPAVRSQRTARRLLTRVAASTDTVGKALVDQGFKNSVVDHGRTLGIDVEIVARDPTGTGFTSAPIRRRVEQTNGLNMPERRLVREYEHAPASLESRIYRASAGRILLRLAGTPARWRGA